MFYSFNLKYYYFMHGFSSLYLSLIPYSMTISNEYDNDLPLMIKTYHQENLRSRNIEIKKSSNQIIKFRFKTKRHHRRLKIL